MSEHPAVATSDLAPAGTGLAEEHRQRLLLRARAGRPLTPNDVVEVMPRVELTPLVLAEVRSFLIENQIPFDEEPIEQSSNGHTVAPNGRVRPRRDPARMAAAAVARAAGSADPVKMYLKEIGKVPLLAAEEEVAAGQADRGRRRGGSDLRRGPQRRSLGCVAERGAGQAAPLGARR